MLTPQAYSQHMDLPAAIREDFQRFGRAGGLARARRMDPEARRAGASLAAIRRWIRVRFGAPSFHVLGLPGGEVVDEGLASLAAGEESLGSLVVSLAAPRLRREGVPLPAGRIPNPEERLYRRLEVEAGDLAHARYLAHLRQIESFANACGAARCSAERHAT